MARVSAEQPPSPPKRVTRARAAKSGEPKPEPKTRGRPKGTTATKPTTRTRKTAKTDPDSTDIIEPKKRTTSKRATKTPQSDAPEDSDETADDELDVVTVRSTSTKSKASAARAGATATKPAPRSKQPAADEDEDEVDDDELAEPEPARTRAAPAKSTSILKSSGSTAPVATVKPTRGRPRKNPTPTTTAEETETENAPKPTRGRKAITVATGSTRAMAPTAASATKSKLAASLPKKRVTFKDVSDSDKENLPLPTANKKKTPAGSQIGLRAKPVRKPTATTGRGRKAASTDDNEQKSDAPKPLSPKKATQVARSASSASSHDDGEEDELSGEKSPKKFLGKSPTKNPSQNAVMNSPAKKIDFVSPTKPMLFRPSTPEGDRGNDTSSPSKATLGLKESVAMATPARRPAKSPFKDSVRETPMRSGLFSEDVVQSAQTPFRDSLRQTPKRAGLFAEMVQATPSLFNDSVRQTPKRANLFSQEQAQATQSDTQGRASPLKMSPRKGNLGASFLQSPAKGFGDTFKASLLQSPAKRCRSPLKVMQSPLKLDQSDQAEDVAEMEADVSRNTRSPTSSVEDDTGLNSLIQDEKRGHDSDGDVFVDNIADVNYDARAFVSQMDISQLDGALDQEDVDDDIDIDIDIDIEPYKKGEDSPLMISETTSVTSSPAPQYEIANMDEILDSVRKTQDTLPQAPSPPTRPAGYPEAFTYRDDADHEVSDDETVIDDSPVKKDRNHMTAPDTPFAKRGGMESDISEGIGFTPLAEKLSGWKAGSPMKSEQRRKPTRGVFSLAPRTPSPEKTPVPSLNGRQLRSSRRSQAAMPNTPVRRVLDRETSTADVGENLEVEKDVAEALADNLVEIFMDDDTHEDDNIQQSTMETDAGRESDEETIYGDENALPSDEPTATHNTSEQSEDLPQDAEDKENDSRTPMSLTPVRRDPDVHRTIHTVSKVPLRPAGDVSPLKVPRKRSRSLSTRVSPRKPTLTLTKSITTPSLSPRNTKSSRRSRGSEICDEDGTPILDSTLDEDIQSITHSPTKSSSKSPTKSLSPEPQVLQGAVVFVDVHTTEGADASGIFVELLTQMGARCVKSWSWNPRSSLSPVDGTDPKPGKVGITHVVYKDGGVRTLEKVREAAGLVKCVGVGWVLDCERGSQWLDESTYAVDLSIIPRGGQKRRKSMEPKAFSNQNGTLVDLNSSTSSTGSKRSGSGSDFSDDYAKVPQTPSSRRGKTKATAGGDFQIPATPGPYGEETDYFNFDESTLSPMTPYYLSQGAKLVQQTCPPKQTRHGLFPGFPVSGRIEDQPDEGLRVRLEAARRKSLVWKPKVGSPLSR